MPPSEYTPSAIGVSEPNPSPVAPNGPPQYAAPNEIPSYIASLPLAPSEPTTPAPFTIPVPAPNLLPNPTSNYCGYGWESANNECYYACPSGKDDECPGGRTCHTWLKCNQAAEDPALYNVCGTTWLDASTKCATRCFLGDESCPGGESCFGNVVECKGNPNLPELTAEDVGQAPKMYTQEEIDAMLIEVKQEEAEAAAMEDPDNWWCGTSWTNMLETCSKRCTKNDDCTVNSWEKATCFKTAGGPGNCAIPGQPAKQASAPGSKWCGYTWNDMLETCSKKCEADEDCDAGKTCWEAPGTCQYLGVPVKEVSDPATLWCGTSFDDAAVSCHKACPSESDDDCPEGMSCFAGSACTEEGVPVVRENYRCGSSWDDAATKCGIECQKDDDCTVENGATAGDICYADVECVSDSTAGSSGMMCVTNWETAQNECATTNKCATDDDCSGGTLCMWIDCLAEEDDNQVTDTTTPGTTTLPGCNAEVKGCPNGKYVARAPELNCEFYPCPEDTQTDTTEPAAEALTDGEVENQDMSQNSQGISDNEVPAGWDTIPLTFASPKCEGECTQCQGDCNSDADCAEGLKCFSRGKGEVTAVPGCVSGGEGDLPGMDYCYLPEPPTTTTTTATTTEETTTTTTEPAQQTSADILAFDAPELKFARECSAEYPCSACEGDCDDDSHCASGLLCFSRIQGSVEFVPGCKGMGIPGMDFCYNPNSPIILPSTDATTTTSAPQEEFSGCSAEVKACPGTNILVYQNPTNGCAFDPCPNESTTTLSSEASFTTASSEASSLTTESNGIQSTGGSTTPNASTQANTIDDEPVTCDTLCLSELPESFCPTEMDSLPNCLNIEIGHICEASGECATSDSLNNCQTFDVYVRVECGGETPTQGYLMSHPQATEGPVSTMSPLANSHEGQNSQQLLGNETNTISREDPVQSNSSNAGVENHTSIAAALHANATANISTSTTMPNITLTEVASVDIISNSTLQSTTISSPAPIVSTDDNETQVFSNLTMQTSEVDISSAAAASFTYDRSPNAGSAPVPEEESFAEFSAQDYSNAESWASTANSQQSDPYYHHEGWDLTGYFTQDAESSSSINSRGKVALIVVAIVAGVMVT